MPNQSRIPSLPPTKFFLRTAAVNNLSSDEEFAKQYQGLLNHYGLKGHRINVRKPQENGDVESANGHIKTAIDQAIRLRGKLMLT